MVDQATDDLPIKKIVDHAIANTIILGKVIRFMLFGQNALGFLDGGKFKCDTITGFVGEIKAAMRAQNPTAILGIFNVPWRPTDFHGAITDILAQDLRSLAAYVDVFSPMVYHLMCGHPPGWIGEVVEEVSALSGKPVWPIVQSVDHPAPLPAGEYAQALEVALGATSSGGVIVFTLEGVLTDEAKLAVTKARFGE